MLVVMVVAKVVMIFVVIMVIMVVMVVIVLAHHAHHAHHVHDVQQYLCSANVVRRCLFLTNSAILIFVSNQEFVTGDSKKLQTQLNSFEPPS